VDAWEQRTQRPTDHKEADEHDSGKKKAHTLKSQIVVELGTGNVREVSPSVPGPVADPPFLRGSGMRERLGPDHRVMGDLGYVGADKDKSEGNDATGKATGRATGKGATGRATGKGATGRATGKGATDTGAEDKKEKERAGGVIPRIVTPRRTPRGQRRPPEDVVFNRTFARARIVVEHSIRDLRIYQALSQVDRRRRTGHERRVCAVVGLRARRCRLVAAISSGPRNRSVTGRGPVALLPIPKMN